MSDDSPGPQDIQLPDLQLPFGRSMTYDQDWLAYFQSQPPPDVAGVDASLHAAGDDGTAIA